MRILVFGAGGMLGHKLVQVLSSDHEVYGAVRGKAEVLSRHEVLPQRCLIEGVDVSDPVHAERALLSVKPEVVINAVGIVKQLPTASDVIATLTINSIFPHRLAGFAEQLGFRLITVSTDCVFDGARGMYTEADRPNAFDLYGKSKELGEVTAHANAVTLRTSIIGRELASSHSLVEWFLSNDGGRVKGFRNAIYSGFPTVVLARIIRDSILENSDLAGLYHVSSDPINKYELLLLLREHYGARIEIDPDDEVRIDRSLDSSRFRAATGFAPDDWGSMILEMASDPTDYARWK